VPLKEEETHRISEGATPDALGPALQRPRK